VQQKLVLLETQLLARCQSDWWFQTEMPCSVAMLLNQTENRLTKRTLK
jgi:hypothetical protein